MTYINSDDETSDAIADLEADIGALKRNRPFGWLSEVLELMRSVRRLKGGETVTNVILGEQAGPLTYVQKLDLLKVGRYAFPPPPVYSGGWDNASWVAFIDARGRWG